MLMSGIAAFLGLVYWNSLLDLSNVFAPCLSMDCLTDRRGCPPLWPLIKSFFEWSLKKSVSLSYFFRNFTYDYVLKLQISNAWKSSIPQPGYVYSAVFITQ